MVITTAPVKEEVQVPDVPIDQGDTPPQEEIQAPDMPTNQGDTPPALPNSKAAQAPDALIKQGGKRPNETLEAYFHRFKEIAAYLELTEPETIQAFVRRAHMWKHYDFMGFIDREDPTTYAEMEDVLTKYSEAEARRMASPQGPINGKWCTYHHKQGHELGECMAFRRSINNLIIRDVLSIHARP